MPIVGPPVTYDVYLQGSYQNDTNISGDSDVDVVLELKSTLYHDLDELSDWECRRLTSTFGRVTYGWNNFRRDALKAMELGFGRALIAQGNKTIKLKQNARGLAADVVVCVNQRPHSPGRVCRWVFLLWRCRQAAIINIPEAAFQNGAR